EADRDLSAAVLAMRKRVVLSLMLCVIGTAVLSAGVLYLLKRMVGEPLEKLIRRAVRFASSGTIAEFHDDIKTGDELQILSEAFGKMAIDVDRYTRAQAAALADKEHLVTELELAARMQQSTLPGDIPDFAYR
ncbi:MAG: hypothetical protein IJG63_06375, partial [Oscillospiraceae bacterium]|nr:hypothetical protein [Oscillospiraceae bacterium]